MARPRVFVSSTYYDLKHIRASLENFIESLGFDAILSERGNIPYDPSLPPDKSCYREVENADLFVLIIGGRYGSQTSETMTDDKKTFYDRYESITKTEFAHAIEIDIPVYILIERVVYADYETFQRNKTNETINYAHADSVNVFLLIADILGKGRNNPYQQFDRYSDIESWLREQWAGRFRDFLKGSSGQTQLASLAEQVRSLTEISTTLKRYMEQVVTKLEPDEAKELIENEEKRLKQEDDAAKIAKLAHGNFVVGMLMKYGMHLHGSLNYSATPPRWTNSGPFLTLRRRAWGPDGKPVLHHTSDIGYLAQLRLGIFLACPR